MPRYSLLVDYRYCTGCHSCEIACNQEYDRPIGLSGIKVFESTMKLGDKFYINYMPVRTDLCNFCAVRIKKGKQPACVQNCLSGCLRVSEIEKLKECISEKDRMMLFT
jgi:Fe-S-cluster-containing dehydrogenase component